MANLKQYGLERFYIDVLVSDAAKVVWRSGDLFDAIVTDRKLIYYTKAIVTHLFIAPYGIREGPRKLGSKSEEPKPVCLDQLSSSCVVYESTCCLYRLQGHIPSVCHYQLTDVYDDLLQFAAKFLVLNGRLVYWLPVDKLQ